MSKFNILFGLLLAAVLLAGCSERDSKSSIEIEQPWARAVKSMSGHDQADANTDKKGEMVVKQNGAAYMTIKNSGSHEDKLLSASSDVADAVEIHLSRMVDGVMKMEKIDYIAIPAGGEAVLQPGGYHIMLIGLIKDLQPGEEIDFSLDFENAGQVQIQAEIHNP
jgi:copper(I)-binding protein